MDKILEQKLNKSSKNSIGLIDRLLNFFAGSSCERLSFGEMTYEELQKIDISHLTDSSNATVIASKIEKSTSDKLNFLK
jgi:hypothetical protein